MSQQIYINEKSQCNRVFIDANKISTVFGRDNFQKYIKNQIAKGNLVRIKNRSSSSSERNALIAEGYRNTASNKRIPQDNSSVNNQSMSDTKNNSTKSKLSVDDTINSVRTMSEKELDSLYMLAVESGETEIAQYLVVIKNQTLGFAFSVSVCTGVALVVSILLSGISGTVIPLIFKKAHIDPAVASGPLITTVNDLIAVVSYYGLSWFLLINLLNF